jgi:hypothetical protein
VDVMVVTPYYVTSNMYKKEPGILNCSAERLVEVIMTWCCIQSA